MKHTNSILEYFEHFCQMMSKSILIISSYTVSNLRHFLRHSVVVKKLRKSVNICQSYWKNKSVSFFMDHSVCNIQVCTIKAKTIPPHTSVLQPSGLCLGLPGWAGTRKVKTNRVAVASAGPYANLHLATDKITMPALHHLVFLQIGCPSCHPSNNVKHRRH